MLWCFFLALLAGGACAAACMSCNAWMLQKNSRSTVSTNVSHRIKQGLGFVGRVGSFVERRAAVGGAAQGAVR